MKKNWKNFGAIFFAVTVFSAVFYYLKFQETDYNSLMKQAYKRKKDFLELSVFDGLYEVSIPDSEMNLKGLGVDTDNNGIRDDIDIWINRTSNNFNERMAMRQYAKIQHVLLKDCYEKKISQESSKNDALEKSKRCLEMISYCERSGKSFGIPMLDILIPNTDFRKSCYRFKKGSKFDKIVSLDLLKTNCNFEVKNPKGMVEISEIFKNSPQN